MKITTPQALRDIAEDYLYLAADKDGKVDVLRKTNYQWLLKVADELSSKERKERKQRNQVK
jgi:hypothetical protein